MFFSFSSFLINILIKRISSLKSFSVTLTIFSSFRKYCTLKKQCSTWNILFWKITKLPSPSNVMNNKDMKKLPFVFNYNFSGTKRRTFKAPMQSNTTSGISHLRYLDNNSGSVCLTVSNSALMTRVLLQRKHRKGQRE